MIISAHAHARAGLVGNPSDGYFGKTISCILRNFKTTVHLWESPHFEIVPSHGDLGKFDNVEAFLRDLQLHGYYGGMRLIKSTLKRFTTYCHHNDIDLEHRNFTVSFETDIPRLVGLSGSSAIIIAPWDSSSPRSDAPWNGPTMALCSPLVRTVKPVRLSKC